MGRYSSFPTLFDSVLQVSITKLKERGYLEPGVYKGGTLTWSRNGNKTASIGITVDMASAPPYIELDYKYGDEPRKYRVRLVSVPSNLGDGEVWYFMCPHTGKRCRILYSVGGWFLHREAHKGVYYDSQVQSKETRNYMRVVGPLFKVDRLYEEMYKPYFKRYYAGVPTKRYARIQKKIEQSKRVSAEDYEKVLAGIL